MNKGETTATERVLLSFTRVEETGKGTDDLSHTALLRKHPSCPYYLYIFLQGTRNCRHRKETQPQRQEEKVIWGPTIGSMNTNVRDTRMELITRREGEASSEQVSGGF